MRKSFTEEGLGSHIKMEAWRQEQVMPARLGICCPQAESEAGRRGQTLGARSYRASTPILPGTLTPQALGEGPSLRRRKGLKQRLSGGLLGAALHQEAGGKPRSLGSWPREVREMPRREETAWRGADTSAPSSSQRRPSRRNWPEGGCRKVNTFLNKKGEEGAEPRDTGNLGQASPGSHLLSSPPIRACQSPKCPVRALNIRES